MSDSEGMTYQATRKARAAVFQCVPTGLRDSNGIPIYVGDQLKQPVQCNEDVHGDWAIYEVVQQGLTPIISYRYSQNGQVVPAGFQAQPLADEYDRKLFCFARDVSKLSPSEPLTVMREFDDQECCCG